MGLRNLGKVTDPGQATSPGELFPCLAGLAADMAIAGMIDEKIELWPILRSFGDIAHIGIAPKVWVTLLQRLGEQSLLYANFGKTGLHRLLIEGIDERFSIAPPRFGQIIVRVFADGIRSEVLLVGNRWVR